MDKLYLTLCDFNPDIYKKVNSDLSSMSNEALENHFLLHGINEGRLYNAIINRKEFIELIDQGANLLEIGPLDKPVANHTLPFYYSLDVFDRGQLIANYINDPNVIKENIVEPTFIIKNNDYSQIKQRFQSIFSSHSIEHVPCIVTFLKNLQGLLNTDGYIYLIIPDKRYCFDYFKRESDIFDVLQLYYEKNFRPRLLDVLKQSSQITHNDAAAHWNEDHGNINANGLLVENYDRILNAYNTGAYIDSHVSCFTPQSFINIVHLLGRLNLINLDIHKIYHTLKGGLEFYAILKIKSQ